MWEVIIDWAERSIWVTKSEGVAFVEDILAVPKFSFIIGHARFEASSATRRYSWRVEGSMGEGSSEEGGGTARRVGRMWIALWIALWMWLC